jgi:endonuclease YncB( thermonuclease family)
VTHEYKAVIVRWVDGDTVIAHIDQGFHDWKHDQRLRLVGIDAPDKQPGKEAARVFADSNWPPGTEIVVRTIRDKHGSEEQTFERWLAEAWADDTMPSLSALLVAAGHARVWNGKGPRP